MRRFLIPLAGLAALWSCTTDQVLVLEPPAEVELVAPYPAMSPGERHRILPVLRDDEGNLLGPRALTWRTTDTLVATVDADGIVTAKAIGTATVIGERDGVADTVAIPVRSSWSGVAVSERLVCAEHVGGGSWCWGDSPGDGTRGTTLTPGLLPGGGFATPPVRSSNVACALDGGDQLRCWSRYPSTSYLYGNGTPTDTSAAPVLAANGKVLSSFGMNYETACGVDPAGKGWCWGSSIRFGVSAFAPVTRSLPDSVRGGLTWRVLKPSAFAVCGLITTGQAYCFGGGAYYPKGILGLGFGVDSAVVPQPVAGGRVFDSLAVSSDRACATTAAHELYCWGGYEAAVPTRVALPPVRSVALYGYERTCALTLDGRVYCWPGVWPTEEVVPLDTDLRFSSISVGAGEACGVTAGGGLYCWGLYLLGDGSRGPSEIPVRVSDPE